MNDGNGAELKGSYEEAERDSLIGSSSLHQILFFSGDGGGLIKLSFN